MGHPLFDLKNRTAVVIGGTSGIGLTLAKGLAEAFGTTAEFWMNLESAYQLAKVKADGDAVARRARLLTLATRQQQPRERGD